MSFPVHTGSLKNTYLLVGLAGVLTLGLILRGYYDGKRFNELSAPQLAAIREVRLEASTAHHEMKHLLSGEPSSASQNVLLYLDQALWYLQSLLASDDHWVTKWKRSTDKVRGNRIPRLDDQLAEIKSYYQKHRRKPVNRQGLDTVLKRSDELFEALWRQLDEIEMDMVQSIARERILFHVSHYALILFGVTLTFAMAFTIRRYEGQRIRAEEALKTSYGQLEDRISERTEALSCANEELKAEVDERRLVEQRLRKSRNTLQTVIDGIKDSLILVDAQMRIRMFNSAAAENFGFISLGKVIGRYCYEAVGQPCRCEGCKIPQAVAQGQMITFDRTYSSEPERMEQVTIYPVVEKDGRPGGSVMRIVDITEEKRFEQQLIRNEKMASLGILVSSIAHEINNPNNFVTFNIPILKEYLEELIEISDQYAEKHPDLELFHMSYPEFRKDILKLTDNIEHGASRISTFVANLRDFSQNNGERQMVWLELQSVVDKVLSICRSQIKKQIRAFEMDMPDDLPLIYADQYSLEQILLNLIVNAIQAADKPDSFVKLSAYTGYSWRDATIITLVDNGSGIDEKTMGRIFDPFFTTKSATEGTGLGLYVSHNLVQNLGGRIEVESRPKEGSTFTVYLPDKDRRKIPRV